MSTRTENHEELVHLIHRLPVSTYYDVKWGGKTIETQANTQAAVAKIRQSFPGVVWEKEYDEINKWWEYAGKFEGTTIRIYACTEQPATCKAIVEKKMVEKKIPIGYETKFVEEDVIVGWDCGDNGTPMKEAAE